MTTKHASDTPPILLFLALFAALMLVALGLAALSSLADEPAAPVP